MIKRIYGALPPGYPSDNVIVGRINAYYRAYGTGYDFCTFYEGENTLALYYGGELYVHCNENTDTESLLAFSDMLGARAVMSDIKLSEKSEELYIMTSDKIPTAHGNIHLKAEFTENYRTIFKILKSGFSLDDSQFDDWYADTCHRVRHGISRLIVMYYGSEPAATATVLFDDDKSCFLSHIAVRRDMQKNGIGTALLSCTANLLDNRKITLACKKSVQQFYINCGFTATGTAYEIKEDKNGLFQY